MQRKQIKKIQLGMLIVTALLAMPLWQGVAFPAAMPGGDVSGLIHAAERQFNSGNYSTAITTLQSAVSQNNTNAEAYYWLARNYYELGDYDNAITQAEKSVALDAKNSIYHMWLGRAYGGKAEREHSFFLAKKVKKEFQDAVQMNPSNIAARRDLEEFNIDAPWIVGGSKDEARNQVDAIAAIDPVEGHLARATLYMDEMKKPDLAENEYREVLKAKPNRIEPYLEVANFFMRENKPTDMDAAIQAAAQVAPNDPRLGYYRGVSRVMSGTDQTHAEGYLKSYIASTPNRSDWPSHAAARLWLGKLYEAEGKRGEAAEQYRAALQLDPGLKEARTQLQQLDKKAR